LDNLKKPELAMFTLLNPGFYGVPEDHFMNKRGNEISVRDEVGRFDAVTDNDDGSMKSSDRFFSGHHF